MKRPEIVVRPSAERDIEQIALYTIEAWGKQQAQTYLARLRADIEGLRETANRHPPANSAIANLRRMRSQQHFVFYQVLADAVVIVRVLHERMDVESRLN